MMFDKLLETVRPLARTIKYGRLLRRAKIDANHQENLSLEQPVSFILGCGRSGTTILGKLLALHSDACYLFEPYHTWRAILPSTDMISLYGEVKGGSHCIIGAEGVTENVMQRFNACMRRESMRSGKSSLVLIEKTPINAMRIPMLSALSPHSPILHLVRNGIDVVRSIDRLASTNSYKMMGKGDWNQWWGRDHCKWKSLASDSIGHGYFSDEIEQLSTNIEMGALEWLVSLKEIEKNRISLGDRLLEVAYGDLTRSPEKELTKICEHLTITPYSTWLQKSCSKLDSARKNTGDPLILPIKMCEAFNSFQEQYKFDGQAIPK